MKFLVPYYGCPPAPLTMGLPPPDPHSVCPLSSTEFVEPPTPNKIPGYATDYYKRVSGITMTCNSKFHVSKSDLTSRMSCGTVNNPLKHYR